MNHVNKEVYDRDTLGEVYSVKSSLYGFNGNMHDWHVFVSEGGGMLYDWGVHLLDQIVWMMQGVRITSVYADGFEPEGKLVRTAHLLTKCNR